MPRHYADEISALPEGEREQAYARVPKHLRAWVRFYVERYYPRLAEFARAAERARVNLEREERHAHA